MRLGIAKGGKKSSHKIAGNMPLKALESPPQPRFFPEDNG
jgi:hypothetical protein